VMGGVLVAALAGCHSSGKTNGCAPPYDVTAGQGQSRVSLLANCGGEVGAVPLPTITLKPGATARLEVSGHPALPSPVLGIAPAGIADLTGMTLHADHSGAATVSLSGWPCASGQARCSVLVVEVH
jgi:hypothetical protein